MVLGGNARNGACSTSTIIGVLGKADSPLPKPANPTFVPWEALFEHEMDGPKARLAWTKTSVENCPRLGVTLVNDCLWGGAMRKSGTYWTLAISAVLLGGVAATQVPAAQAPVGAWPQPDAASLSAGASKDVVLYGRKVFQETYATIGPEVADASMRYAGNNLSCQNCHLD